MYKALLSASLRLNLAFLHCHVYLFTPHHIYICQSPLRSIALGDMLNQKEPMNLVVYILVQCYEFIYWYNVIPSYLTNYINFRSFQNLGQKCVYSPLPCVSPQPLPNHRPTHTQGNVKLTLNRVFALSTVARTPRLHVSYIVYSIVAAMAMYSIEGIMCASNTVV